MQIVQIGSVDAIIREICLHGVYTEKEVSPDLTLFLRCLSAVIRRQRASKTRHKTQKIGAFERKTNYQLRALAVYEIQAAANFPVSDRKL